MNSEYREELPGTANLFICYATKAAQYNTNHSWATCAKLRPSSDRSTLWTGKTHQMFCHMFLQNPVDSDKIWYTLSWI